MDFGKIWKGSMIPIAAMLAITVVSMLIGQVPIVAMLGLLFFVVGLGINLWLGYNGVKAFKFDYADAAVGGAMLGVVNGVVSLVLGMAFVSLGLGAAEAGAAASPYGGAVIAGATLVVYLIGIVGGTIISIVLAVIGAAGANYIK